MFDAPQRAERVQPAPPAHAPTGIGRIRHDLQLAQHELGDHQRTRHEAAFADFRDSPIDQRARVHHDQRHVHLVRHETHVGDYQIELVLPAQRDDGAQISRGQKQRQSRQENHLRVAVLQQRRAAHQVGNQAAHTQAEGDGREPAQRKPLQHHVGQHQQKSERRADDDRPVAVRVPLRHGQTDQKSRRRADKHKGEADG